MHKTLRIISGRFLAAVLSFLMVFAMFPYLGSDQGQAFADDGCDDTGYWGEWSTALPSDSDKYEARTEYRYRDKQTTTSYSTSLAGYTQSGWSWVQSGSGTIDYVPYLPSGFNHNSQWYRDYYNVTPRTASETATTKTTVSTSTVRYIYWHWCRGYTGGPINRLVSDTKSGDYKTWHCFTQTTPITFDSSKKSFYKKHACCSDSYWWMTTGANQSSQLVVKRCSYTDYRKLFSYYRWTDWSGWSTNPAYSSSNRIAETRTLYRIYNYGSHTWDSGKVTRKASCAATGTRLFTCTSCGKTRTATIRATGAHQWGAWKTVKHSTDTASGLQKRSCAVCGKTESKTLSRLTPTLKMVSIKAPETNGQFVLVKWKKVAKSDRTRTRNIQIQYSTDRNFSKNVKSLLVSSKKASVKLKNLTKKKQYYVRVRAYSKVGYTMRYSKWSPVKAIKLSAGKPARVKLKNAKPKKGKLILYWKRVSKNTVGYQVGIKNHVTGDIKYINAKQGSTKTITKTLKNFKKGHEYAVKVRAYNRSGNKFKYGKWSRVMEGKVN